MQIKKPITSISLAALWVVACSTLLDARTFTTPQRAEVRQIDENQFEVMPARRGANGYKYWCAAAIYAVEGLGLPWTTPITISQQKRRDENQLREIVTYTINPTAAGISTFPVAQINTLQIGHTMSANRGASLCAQGRSRR